MEKEFTIVKSEVFNHPKFGNLRAMTDPNGETWFVGKVVAEALGYSSSSHAMIAHVEKCDSKLLIYKASSETLQASLWQGNDYSNKTLINESGLYSLVLGSKLPQARVFKHWVTAEVLPAIRKDGGYMVATPQMSPEEIMARAVLLGQQTIERLQTKVAAQQQEIEEARPMVQFAQAITASESSILIGDLAKLITQNGYEIGRTRLFQWLREHGFLFKRETRPIQEWVEKGLFEIESVLIGTHHGTKQCFTVKVTPKGQEYFLNRFKQ